ncbi:MAG TPA: CopG family antitoxin [Candidatus Binataceae bacterium]|nr:CopG family antitoxin [Candidatus Binataceae bacterium]HVB82594.1 CopG family antitoxin [Candidatus Binataceae bacterium]
MKKKLPRLRSDKEAEDFVEKADLTEYDLSGMRPIRFELQAQRRMSVNRNYLHRCFEAFEEVTKERYGTAQDLAAIESAVAPLRNRRPLTYDDLREFESPRNWGFKTWWVFPPEHHVTAELKSPKFNFWRLPENEHTLVKSLLDVFKSIELVSIILRFVRPEHYGIISPPVERILDVRRGGNAVETYLNYIEDLRAIAGHYGFKRVADADMALWVFYERCFGSTPDAATQTEYANDPFIRKLRAKNLMGHFLEDSTYAQRADSLLETNHIVAGQFGGIAFEQMVRKRGPRGKDWDEKELKVIIDELYSDGVIDDLTHGKWQQARHTRNKAIHMNPPPTPEKVKQLIELLDLSTPDPAPARR